jgi:hypothetical protein
MKLKFAIISAATVVFSLAMTLPLLADEDEHEEREHRATKRTPKTPCVTPVANEVYTKECGSCHFAYQPGLLPKRSWEKLMTTLDDHFAENAELSAETQTQLTTYLTENAADNSRDRVPVKLMRELPETETPLRITEISYMKHEHRKLSKKMVVENSDVKSLSYCDKCHTRADAGSYSEREIKVPGFENYRW